MSDDELKIPRAPGVPRDLAAQAAASSSRRAAEPGPDPGDEHEEPPPASTRMGALLHWLVAFQVRTPFRVLGVALLITAVAALGAFKLRILSGFENLLPEDRPSVIELGRVAERTAGVSTVFVVLEAPTDLNPPPTAELRKAADALVPALVEVGAPWVGSAESGMHEAVDFLAPRAALYAELGALEKLRDDVQLRFDYEIAKDGWVDDVPPAIDKKRIEEAFGVSATDTERYPDGYYQSKDGRTLVVALRSKIAGSDLENGSEALERIRAAVEGVDPKSYHPSITWGLSGDLVSAIGEYSAINRDLQEVGLLGLGLLAGVVMLYYLRLRTLFTMMFTILVGVTWAGGLAYLMVGHLNTATGFLFTIIAGNGINSGIIYMARYLEARRKGSSLIDGLAIAHREVWLPTLTAAAAASASFASLYVSEFRGFRDFGLIGGAGMVICWGATFLILPAILSIFERISPIRPESEQDAKGLLGRLRKLTQGGVAFGTPFAKLVDASPRLVAVLGFATAVVGVAAMVFYIESDPMEYDLKNLRTDVSARAEEVRLTKLAEEITGHVGADGMAILVDRVEQVPLLEKALREVRDAAPVELKPFADVHALQDFVPKDQEAKLPVVMELKKKLLLARKRHAIDDEQWKVVERFLPPDDLRPYDIGDMPAALARAFTESDGTVGRIVYISPTKPEYVDDARYLFRWADSYRETKLPDGSVVRGSGRAVIYADLWSAVLSDVPKAVGLSALATILVVLIAFRFGRPAIAVLLALGVGVAWMALVLVALGVKLNFLNFVALPLTFGIGVDYAVNIVQRYVRDGVGSAIEALQETGGAVILCSLTTALGYFALVGSMNSGVRSLGTAAVIGELTCLLAAVIVLPGFLIWVDSSRPTGAPSRFSLPEVPRASKPSIRPEA